MPRKIIFQGLCLLFFVAYAATISAHEWRLIDSKHWQVVSNSEKEFLFEKSQDCLDSGSIYVSGWMLQDTEKATVEELQKSACISWINKTFPERCKKFDKDKWLRISKNLPRKPMSFCIDTYEYPNIPGENPWIMVSWVEASKICEEENKRLCTEDEWTFACEGEEATPYPYGYERDDSKCNIDHRWRHFHESILSSRHKAEHELDRLWQGHPSGDMRGCVSSFGVYDMTGNVDEWTTKTRPGKHPSILKGGYWGPVRTRCRPSTRNHGKEHYFYQQGFRCCSDPIAQPYEIGE